MEGLKLSSPLSPWISGPGCKRAGRRVGRSGKKRSRAQKKLPRSCRSYRSGARKLAEKLKRSFAAAS